MITGKELLECYVEANSVFRQWINPDWERMFDRMAVEFNKRHGSAVVPSSAGIPSHSVGTVDEFFQVAITEFTSVGLQRLYTLLHAAGCKINR